MLDLRRDISVVLTNLLEDLKRKPDEAKQLISSTPTAAPAIVEDEGAAQVERLRGEFLDLRRDVAVVMVNLLIGAGRSQEEARRIVIDALKPKTNDRARGLS